MTTITIKTAISSKLLFLFAANRSIEGMDPWLVGLTVLAILGLCSTSAALTIQVKCAVENECCSRFGWKLEVKMYFDDLPFCIQVYKDGQVLETYSDNNAAFYDRSYQMPTSPVQVFNMKFVA